MTDVADLPLFRPVPESPPSGGGSCALGDPDWLANPCGKIAVAFAVFHRRNPHVYAELERLALLALHRNAKRIGMKSLYETLRFRSAIRTAGEPWKLNNSYTALYARLLIHRRPELAPVIETRRRHDGDRRAA